MFCPPCKGRSSSRPERACCSPKPSWAGPGPVTTPEPAPGLPGAPVDQRFAGAIDRSAQVQCGTLAHSSHAPPIMPPPLVRLAGMSEPVLVSMLLGYPRSDLRRRLVDAVLRGEKTATSSLLSDYGPDESLPQLGEREILRGFDDDDALAIVETTD